MNFKFRIGARLGFILCSCVLVFAWALRTRVGTVHPLVLVTTNAGVTPSFIGLIAGNYATNC